MRHIATDTANKRVLWNFIIQTISKTQQSRSYDISIPVHITAAQRTELKHGETQRKNLSLINLWISPLQSHPEEHLISKNLAKFIHCHQRFHMCYIYSITWYKNKIKNRASSTHFIVRTSINSIHSILYLLIIFNRVPRKLCLTQD